MSNEHNISQQGRPFGLASGLPYLLNQGGTGFYSTKGFHIYCELRPKSNLEFAEDDARALRYVQTIEEFTNHGIQAATPFKVALLELQGNVLHFYKEAELNIDTAREAIQFVFLFTTTLYEALKPQLGDDWDGFASCMEHGPSIIVRHNSIGCSSAVSLGPAANSPAKQLLYGKTPAGCVDVPSGWAKALGGSASGNWFTINLRNREMFPFVTAMENAELRRQLQAAIQAFRADSTRSKISTIAKANKIQGACVQADLDGFSAVVKQAFESGQKEIESVAFGFAKVLEFGDFMRQSTPGTRALPWAGDRAPTIVPKNVWLDFSMRWQSFASGTPESQQRGWGNLFKNVKWSIGGCHGKTGSNIVVPIRAQGRDFLVATGWPMAVSMEAQNVGKADDIVTSKTDYDEFDAATKSLFSKVTGTDFWKTTNITSDKIKRAGIELGKSQPPSSSDYLSKYSTIQVPSPRPHFR